jgi:acetyl esterase/lipase
MVRGLSTHCSTRFRPPMRLLALLFSVTLVAGALSACAPVTTINALTITSTYELQENVAYGQENRQRLDIYRPVTAAPAGGWPVAVFFYGGSWNRGDRADYKFVGEALASRGIVALVTDYRVYPDVRYPDFLTDSALAVAYGLKEAARLGGNPKRVFAMGHSAGGYNAAMVALDPRWLQAAGTSPKALAGWVGLAGPYDFYPIENPDAKPVFNHPDYPPNSQPIEFALAGSPRTFLGAATKDSLVNPQRNTQALAGRLKANGVPVTVEMYKHVNHVTLAAAMAQPLRWLAPVLKDVAKFINEAPPALQ